MAVKLTKSRIVKFLEARMAKQLSEIEKEIQASLEAEKLRILTDSGFVSFYKKWQDTFNLAFNEKEHLQEELTESGVIGHSYQYNTRDLLYKLSGEDQMLSRDLERLYFSAESFKDFEESLYEGKRVIRGEWDKLIKVVKAQSSVKTIREYLANLNIDLSELEKQVEAETPQLPSTDIWVDLLKF